MTDEILTKAVAEILPNKKGLLSLMNKRKIRVYLGVDPTSPLLHIGHSILLRKLRQFQDLGHEVILLFGTFTAQIGDPSGRDKLREPLSEKDIKKNMATYKKQAEKILDAKKITYKKNGDWLSKLTFSDVIKISSKLTVSQILERDMFQERLRSGNEVWVHEFLYPIMQGYDSVVMDVDLEIGGTDQMFNMLVGRKLQKAFNNKEKFVLTTPLLIGLDGRKMSKSYNNTIDISDSPEEMYGKIMSLKDDLIPQYFDLLTNTKKEAKEPPRDAKARLAKEIVATYYGKSGAKKAEKAFERTFKEKRLPIKIPGVKIKEPTLRVVDLLIESGLETSVSAARRVVEQGGVKIGGRVMDSWDERMGIKKGLVIQVGKRRFKRVL